MIGIDTNVLVRYLTQDDASQAAIANGLIDGAAERGEQVYLSALVLCELVWVLRRVYGLRKSDILVALNGILGRASATPEASSVPRLFRIEQEARVREAVEAFSRGKVDFADHLIGCAARDAGATTTYTFDRTAARAPLFKLAE